jgi:hypothetical protein
MTTVKLFASLAFLLIATAGAYPPKVTVDYDRTVDFSAFQTYAWARGAQAANPLIDRRIIEAIDSRLGATGLQRVDGSGDPDLVVVYYATADTTLEANTNNLGLGTVTGPPWRARAYRPGRSGGRYRQGEGQEVHLARASYCLH